MTIRGFRNAAYAKGNVFHVTMAECAMGHLATVEDLFIESMTAEEQEMYKACAGVDHEHPFGNVERCRRWVELHLMEMERSSASGIDWKRATPSRTGSRA